MTNAGQPSTIEERLSRLETLFSNVGETVLAQNNAIAALGASVQQTNQNVSAQSATIDVLVANIQQLTESVAAVNQRVDSLAQQTNSNINNLTNRMDRLAAEAAADRQQAAIDRQEFRTEIRRIWEYLRDRNGSSSPPQA
ncbi:hypothetical protein F7734_46505 [Scytonema sp. UIC 10036]|uniref:hypothetical protein n=1 Tax=Scytonema sp. UIC 10036 TaxID=2304196 RepID=UPI0012DAD38D|nr:hypothetical protein [Scytonema sp. UIC 10036]MUG99347.1 hypothetical protein [Scytonema sp. UIC 10036]